MGSSGPSKPQPSKANDLIRAAVRRVFLHKPLQRRRVADQSERAGRGRRDRRHSCGADACRTPANTSIMVEREPTIGGHMAKFDKTFPTLDCAACILTPKMTAVGTHPEHHALDLLGSGERFGLRRQLQGASEAQAALHH